MPSSSVTRQTEEVLEEVLRIIRQEYDSPSSVLCEADRNRFVEEEKSLSKQLKGVLELESNSLSWRNLLRLPSPQAVTCLKEAEELRQRVKEDIKEKLRTRLAGKSSPPPLLHGQNSDFNFLGARTPDIDTLLADGNPEPTSLLNMRCSSSEPEVSEVNVNPAVRNDHGLRTSPHNIRCFLSEPEVSPLETSSESSDRNRDSSVRRHRRSPPPPPPLRRIVQSGNSSETSSSSGSDTPRRSHSVRRPAPPPPQSPRQSRTPRSPTIISFPSPGPLPLDPAAISRLVQHANALASSAVTECSSRQAQGGRGKGVATTVKTNCLDINRSNVRGVTLNNGGTNNSGAVIHETKMPSSRFPQRVPPF